MLRPRRWSALIPGLSVLAAIAAASTAVLVFARVGAIHGSVMRLFLTTSRARGVISGTDVWLDGESVGRVAWVRFRPPTVDTAQRLLIALDVKSSMQPFVRRDTRAEIRSGASLIGAPVVYLSHGTSNAPSVVPNDTLATRPQADLDGVRAQVVVLAQDLPLVLGNVETMRHQLLFPANGTIGTLTGDEGVRRFAVLTDRAARLSGRVSRRGGTVAALESGELVEHVERTLAAVRSVEREVSESRTTKTEDSRLMRDIKDARAQLADMQVRLAPAAAGDTTGPAGALPGTRLTQLRSELSAADSTLRALAADVGHRPFRYFTF